MKFDQDYLKKIENYAFKIAHESGEILHSYFPDIIKSQDLTIEYKDLNLRDPVTEADKKIQSFLSEKIKSEFPDHGIVGEEGESQNDLATDYVWVLDPLDGTRNFMYGFPIYACSIGVLYQGEPVVGAIFIPWPNSINSGRVVHASLGNGFSIDGDTINTSKSRNLDGNSLITLPGFFHKRYKFSNDFLPISGELRMGGSIAYEILMVALGISQYAVISSAYLWDITGGLAIIKEANCSALSVKINKNESQWSKIDPLVQDWQSGVTKLSDLRLRTNPMLIAPTNYIDELKNKISRKNSSIKKVVNGIFNS